MKAFSEGSVVSVLADFAKDFSSFFLGRRRRETGRVVGATKIA
jgi:hypothetical protein